MCWAVVHCTPGRQTSGLPHRASDQLPDQPHLSQSFLLFARPLEVLILALVLALNPGKFARLNPPRLCPCLNGGLIREIGGKDPLSWLCGWGFPLSFDLEWWFIPNKPLSLLRAFPVSACWSGSSPTPPHYSPIDNTTRTISQNSAATSLPHRSHLHASHQSSAAPLDGGGVEEWRDLPFPARYFCSGNSPPSAF